MKYLNNNTKTMKKTNIIRDYESPAISIETYVFVSRVCETSPVPTPDPE